VAIFKFNIFSVPFQPKREVKSKEIIEIPHEKIFVFFVIINIKLGSQQKKSYLFD